MIKIIDVETNESIEPETITEAFDKLNNNTLHYNYLDIIIENCDVTSSETKLILEILKNYKINNLQFIDCELQEFQEEPTEFNDLKLNKLEFINKKTTDVEIQRMIISLIKLICPNNITLRKKGFAEQSNIITLINELSNERHNNLKYLEVSNDNSDNIDCIKFMYNVIELLKNSNNITSLDISNNDLNISEYDIRLLSRKDPLNLQELNISGNTIELYNDLSNLDVSELKNLSISLDNNNKCAALIKKISQESELQQLTIGNTPWGADIIDVDNNFINPLIEIIKNDISPLSIVNLININISNKDDANNLLQAMQNAQSHNKYFQLYLDSDINTNKDICNLINNLSKDNKKTLSDVSPTNKMVKPGI